MTEKLKPTPGPWVFSGDEPELWEIEAPGGWLMCGYPYEERTPNKKDDWLLIAEAGTVHHECGLSPRELLEGYRGLRKELACLRSDLLNLELVDLRSAGAALAKHKEV